MADPEDDPSLMLAIGGGGLTPVEDEPAEVRTETSSATPTLDDTEAATNNNSRPIITASIITSLAPGVSAAGAEAAAAALEDIPLPEADDVSGVSDLGDLAVLPVVERDKDKALSMSSVSGLKDEISSLSGLSSVDGGENRLLVVINSDVEDGEIQAAAEEEKLNGIEAAPEQPRIFTGEKRRGRLGNRRLREANNSSPEVVMTVTRPIVIEDEDDDDDDVMLSSGSPRPHMLSKEKRKLPELPRYDVRNIIQKKREKKKRRSNSRSHSRSRSNSRSRRRKKKHRSRSRSGRRSSRYDRSPPPPLLQNANTRRRSSRSFSRSPVNNRKNSLSRSPMNGKSRRKKSSRRRSVSRSVSPINNSRRKMARRRSASISRSRSPPPIINNSRRKKARRSGSRSPPPTISRRKKRPPSRSPVSSKKRKKRLSPPPPASRSRRYSRSPSPVIRARKSPTTKKRKKSPQNMVKKKKMASTSSSLKKAKKVKKTRKNDREVTLKHVDDEDDHGLNYINAHSASTVADKEVFASGDKIMVSVNFKNNHDSSKKASKEAAASKKPSVVIDVMASPYQVIENSPQEVVDVLSDLEEAADGVKKSLKERLASNPEAAVTAKSPAEQQQEEAVAANETNQDEADGVEDVVENTNTMVSMAEAAEAAPLTHMLHKGPCTPPPEAEDRLEVSRGPQTPEEQQANNSCDPCNPTESPPNMNNSDNDNDWNDQPLLSSSSSSSNEDGSVEDGGSNSLLNSAANAIPFLLDDSLMKRLDKEKAEKNSSEVVSSEVNNDQLPVDMDMDSPFSPQSSEMSDIFEPPLNTPLMNKKLAKRPHHQQHATNKHSRMHHKQGKGNKNNKHIHMRMIDDKLRIIDDVPTSAVEMAVKEKFLKKVQRQERIVEEIKTVLKPYYNRKKINKEDYKDILRKCVPKVCHSKNGDINPTKIQKLVKGYVRKYHHSRKKILLP